MLTRDFDFLKDKYMELLLPTLLMLLSDKICLIADAAIIGLFFIDSSFLSSIDLSTPFIYFSAILYTLFGVGGSLLALRTKADQNDEKANFYFTFAIVGVIISNIVFIAFSMTIGNDLVILLYDVPSEIYETFLSYNNILLFYFPFICYILVLGYFARSDGYPKLPFISLLIANVSNIIISLILMGVFHLGVEGSALGSVIGYAIGSVYISTYFLKKDRDFFLITNIKIKESFSTLIEFIKNTPEIISRTFLSAKVVFFTYLSSQFLGIAGLMALLIYDNSETLVYMFLSAIGKVMSPIVAVFYKEKDYEAVEYIIKKSLKQVLIISIPISILFLVYPELFVYLFTLDDPAEAEVICMALRITSLGLIGRCLSILLSNYAQAIEKNKLSYFMNLSEEFIFAFGGALVLTSIFGGVGIWYAIVLADTVPVIIYFIITQLYMNKNKDRIKSLFMLQESNTVTWTYKRGNDDEDSYVSVEKKKFLHKLENMFNKKSPIAIQYIMDIFDNILEDEEVINIDIIIRYVEDTITITSTYGGKLLNPISDYDSEKIGEMGGNVEYSPILGFNRFYINIPV